MGHVGSIDFEKKTPGETKQPMWVHCAACHHEWVCAYLPMEIRKLAPLMKQARCPQCSVKKAVMGKYPAPTPNGDPIAWICGGDTGTSSKTIWAVMMRRQVDEFIPESIRSGVPHDPADFGRCYRLLEIMPEWKPRLREVAAAHPDWHRLVDAWDELTALYLEELPTGVCRKLYDRMKELGV